MEKFELEELVRARLDEAVAPEDSEPASEPAVDSRNATVKITKFELPAGALPTGGEFTPQPVPDAVPESEEANAPDPDATASAQRVSHPPMRPRAPSGPTLKEVQEEPSVIVDKPADPEALRTRLAKKFVSLADDVNEEFKEFTIGAGAWGVELTAPQGMSTGGGKQALQHLRMRARRPGYSVLVGGTVNQVEKIAELRDYRHMCMMHEVRFKKRLEITENEWEQFLRKAEVVLREAQVRCERVGPTKDLIARRRGMTRVSRIAAAAFAVIMVLAAIVLFRIFST